MDQLFLDAESMAKDFSLFPRKEPASVVKGLLKEQQIEMALENFKSMEVDSYIAATVAPTEESTRSSSKEIIAALGVDIYNEIDNGPLYCAELELEFDGELRRIGFITQNRTTNSGVWGPDHHKAAAKIVASYATRSMPIVTFMDTPGADPYEDANANNQAHTISTLIAELCNVDVPTLGIIVGQGYSGGAIPLAASNLLFSLRTGVFNTIHPKSLANLVRRYNLSWQECAKFVGVSSYELYKQGNIDGIIDFDPGEESKIDNLKNSIITGISFIENSTKDFVARHPEVINHYQRNLNRYLNSSDTISAVHSKSNLRFPIFPTEWSNIFGVAFRYLRYVGLRRRIKSTTTTQYGRLAETEIPEGELSHRIHRERRAAFLGWLQDPDKVIYEDSLNQAWKNFQEKRKALGEERGRIAQFIFGEPQSNFDIAKNEICLVAVLHLYNRWKASAKENLSALIEYLSDIETSNYFLSTSDIKDVKGLLKSLSNTDDPFRKRLKQKFSFEGKKLFDQSFIKEKNAIFLVSELVSELNLILESGSLYDEQFFASIELSEATKALVLKNAPSIVINRRILEDTLWSNIERKTDSAVAKAIQDIDIIDVVIDEDIRESFISNCHNLILFDYVYENMIANLVSMAREANESKSIPYDFISDLLEKTIQDALKLDTFKDHNKIDIQRSFALWMERLSTYSGCSNFLKSVEEWICVVHKDKSDTLFVIVSFFFEKILPEYYASRRSGSQFEGKIKPARIGRRKDFWNRLNIAYRDLLLNDFLNQENRSKRTTYETILNKYVENFEEISGSLMSANPCSFPTFRASIESALNSNIKPHGLVTGIGDFKAENGCYRAGLVLSNVAFQAGSIDNSDCERFCNLLVECATQRLPVICFISSGGMQTKEGAAALFTMPVVNDLITRFIIENDLPIIMFGFGHCTGGAQASFVTHPLVQTYYLSGTRMPFAGQAVVERNLPYHCMMSNYLSLSKGSMAGLVKNPFSIEHDKELQKIDPTIPLPTESVEQVIDRVMDGILDASGPVIEQNTPKEEDLIRPIRKVLIHARGCTAVKLVSRAKTLGYEVVLIQSDPDMESVPADMVLDDPKHSLVCIGGNTSDESYLNALSVISIADAEQVDSLHPGIGFLSEDPNFANLVRQHSINFIGPSVKSMETMGNKSNAISTTMTIDVPVVPGSHGIVESSEKAAEISEQIGYPVLLKAVHGGGGKGIQVVKRSEQMHRLFHQATTEAKAAFGNGDVYIEKYITSLRHIEAQLLRDTHGNTRVIGIRDCSVQRNNQKLMEESGSTILPKRCEEKILRYTQKIADAVNYIGAGTVEFIYDIPNDDVYFMEMNTRLQVEHPVTEVVTGVDIVEKQFQIASGESIADMKFSEEGYGLEVRVNAEKAIVDSEGNISFVPTPGEIKTCVLPEADHIELISIAGEGKVISPFYDSLIIQIICYGKDRKDAVNKMSEYLDSVVIRGICTNIPIIKKILKDDVFLKGKYDTGYLPAFLSRIDSGKLINEIEEASGNLGKGFSFDMLKIDDSDELKVLSPSTGVFYRAPSPSEPEYVNVGDVVSTKDVLCELEAMKMFSTVCLNTFAGDDINLYNPDSMYKITRINITDGQQVNEGDLLFVIRPVASES